MSKHEIIMPEKYAYSVDLKVRNMDVRNAAVHGANVSHMVFDMYLSYVNEAFDLFLANYGFSKFDIDGVNLIIPNCLSVFKAELNPEDVVTIEVVPGNFENKACDLFFRMTKKEKTIPVADVKLGIIFFDYGTHKPTAVPEKFSKLFTV